MSGVPVYDLIGLRVRSPVPLGVPSTGVLDPDVEVTLDPPPEVPPTAPQGEVLAELVKGGERYYIAVRTEHGYTLRFYEQCDFSMSPDGRTIRCQPQAGLDLECVALYLLIGTVAAFLLTLRGVCALHSTTAIDDAVLAFVGTSGIGKSTLVALLCAESAALVTDDILRIDFGGDVVCTRGSSEICNRPA